MNIFKTIVWTFFVFIPFAVVFIAFLIPVAAFVYAEQHFEKGE